MVDYSKAMKIKISELSGRALDWAVLTTEGHSELGALEIIDADSEAAAYSAFWDLGGPIIEREKMGLEYTEDWEWRAWSDWPYNHTEAFGSTPLVAAMRCLVYSQLGYEIEVPEELLRK